MITSKPSFTIPDLSLGAKIRQHRKARSLTLTELAEQCDISPSFLSQIERDQANPSVATLHTIAEVFGLTLATFFEEPGRNNSYHPPTEISAKVVRANQRKILIYPGSGIRNELLSPDLQRDIQMMWVVIPPGADTGDVPLVHEGEECGFVLQGQVEVWVGDEHFLLGPGDAIYQSSTVPHRSRNVGPTDAIIVVAITPPSF
jgi:transcriptional regulator with XRE-family HTH domain